MKPYPAAIANANLGETTVMKVKLILPLLIAAGFMGTSLEAEPRSPAKEGSTLYLKAKERYKQMRIAGGVSSTDPDFQSFESQFYEAMANKVELPSTGMAAGAVVFRDTHHGFTVEVPDNWSLEEGFSDDSLDFVVIALSPEEGEADPFIENMNILVETMGERVELRDYFMWNLVGLMEELPSFHMHHKSNALVNGIRMALIVYSWDLEKEKTATYQYIFVRGKKGYVITFSAEPKNFERYRDTFDRIAASFQFSD